MERVEDFINDIVLEHAEMKRIYDPVKAREYYLRTRELKGRTKAAATPKKTLNEDEVPMTSKSGAKLVDFSKGVGTYEDGSRYSAEGWSTPSSATSSTAQIRVAQAKITKAQTMARALGGEKGDALLKQLAETQRKLDQTKASALRSKPKPKSGQRK